MRPDPAADSSCPTKLVIGCGYLGRPWPPWRAAGRRVFADHALPPTAPRNSTASAWNPSSATYSTPTACSALPAAADVVYCVGLDRTAGTRHADGVRGRPGERAGRCWADDAEGRFVYVSSTGVYAQRDGEEVDETAATEPASESGRVVLEAERLLRDRVGPTP